MTLGSVRVMVAGVVILPCVEEVSDLIHVHYWSVCVLAQNNVM